jgi:hypothetical protein
LEKKLFQRLASRKSKKALLASLLNVSLLLSITAVTGCSSLPETITGSSNHYPGYTSYDPCTRCGESWQKLPNQYMNALRTKERWDAERAGKELPKTQIDIGGPVEQPKVIIIE